MKRKYIWLVVSCFMVAALLLASCAPAEEEEEVVTPGEEEEVAPPEEEEVVPPGKEMVKVTLKKLDGTTVELLKEKPKYGGVFTLTLSSDPTGFDEAYTASYMTFTLKFTNEELLTGDWTRGPAGTGECTWLIVQFLPDCEIGGVAESWEIVDDRTVRFHIRKGIHFALNPDSEASRLVGGREMTAHDVVYSLKRHFLTPGMYVVSGSGTLLAI